MSAAGLLDGSVVDHFGLPGVVAHEGLDLSAPGVDHLERRHLRDGVEGASARVEHLDLSGTRAVVGSSRPAIVLGGLGGLVGDTGARRRRNGLAGRATASQGHGEHDEQCRRDS